MDNFMKGILCGAFLTMGAVTVSQNFSFGMLFILAGLAMNFVKGE